MQGVDWVSRHYSQCLEAGRARATCSAGWREGLRASTSSGHYDLSPEVYLTLLVAGVKCSCDHTDVKELKEAERTK